MSLSPATPLTRSFTRLTLAIAVISVTALANAENIIGEASTNSYFSVALISAGLMALIVMRRYFPHE